MSRKHYVVAVTRRQRQLFLLWFGNDEDGLVTDNAAVLRTFATADAAVAFARKAVLELGDESPTFYDLDEVEAWADAPTPGAPLDALLNAWNLLTDIARSVGNRIMLERVRAPSTLASYDRLAKSCIPALEADPNEGLLESDYPTIATALRHGLFGFDEALPAREDVSLE